MSNNIPRKEYPRPDFERNEWLNLNGEWDFEFDDSNIGEKESWYKNRNFTGKIIVPFCYQSVLSDINNQDFHEYMWYKRSFKLPEDFWGKRIFLNFGAVDYYAKVWVNGELAGTHKGGYVPFKFDITKFLTNGINSVVVKAEDRYECVQPRGKQYWKHKPDRCWYTPTSGIWQTVWLETTGKVAIDRIKLTPDIDRRNVLVEIFLDSYVYEVELSLKICYDERIVSNIKTVLYERISKVTVDLREEDFIDEVHYWTPEHPNLYDVELKLEKDSVVFDTVKSYFGMRKISVKGDQIMLNNRPYYQRLVLDQGYWKDSLLTPPSDEAIRFDIEMSKKFGFNGARKHQKIEDPRYYYWADKLGLLVWGEMPSAYYFNDEEVENLTCEWIEFIKRDYNHPCIVTWVPLNESWGVRNIYINKHQQSFARSLYYIAKALDNTRLISVNDGWEQIDGDICCIHDYIAWGNDFVKRYSNIEKVLESDPSWRMLYCEGSRYNGQPILITEYGGIAFKDKSSESWGYNDMVKDKKSFFERYSSITSAIRNMPIIRGYCYTQLTDVQQEVNGLMTEDRKVKVSVEHVSRINNGIFE